MGLDQERPTRLTVRNRSGLVVLASIGLGVADCGGVALSTAAGVDGGGASDASAKVGPGPREGGGAGADVTEASCAVGTITIGGDHPGSGIDTGTSIAVDSTNVYFVDSTSSIVKIPLCGGKASTLAS